ncbi:MAG: metal ABC transporter ATP-binding protein [Armatimonadota bacterium]
MIIRLENVELAYGRGWTLSGIDFSVPEGDFLAIVGPNGSGKSTLLKAMLGIIKPRHGEVKRAPGIRFGYVPQSQHIDEIYPLTALDITLMGRYSLMGPLSRPSRKDRETALGCLSDVGMGHLADQPYRNLSGGQKQRTLIARALACESRVMILDEPTNDMDIAGEAAIMDLLHHLHKEHGMTVVMVSHLLNVVSGYAKNIALIIDGKITVGTVDDILSPVNLATAYGTEVRVADMEGHRIVIAGGTRC